MPPSLEASKIRMGRALEQTDVLKDVPAHGSGVGTGLSLEVPSKPFYDLVQIFITNKKALI